MDTNSASPAVDARADDDESLGFATEDLDFATLSGNAWRSLQEAGAVENVRRALLRYLGGRIREARTQSEMSLPKLAKLLDVHENTLGKMERGISLPDAMQLLQIAALTGKTVPWLLGAPEQATPVAGDPVPRSLTAVEHGDMIYIPLFDLRASAGPGAFNDQEQVLVMRPFARDYIRRELHILHNEIALVTVVGNSMEPEIHSGDVVLVDRKDKDISVEGPHLVRVDGSLLVKLVQRRPGGVLRVASKNELYPPFDINVMSGELSDFEVLGRVRWAGVTFR